jgi:triacylglycerol lipase
MDYFPQIQKTLTEQGYRVEVPRLHVCRGVSTRALQLRNFLNEAIPNERCHIIAHSLGGLDARYMASRLDMQDRILSITTLGTPHRGSFFADWCFRHFGRVGYPLIQLLLIPTEAFMDLTVEKCKEFDEVAPDVPGIAYRSIAGQCSYRDLQPFWKLSGYIVGKHEGPNDGIVSVTSASRWHSEVWEADHMNLVNRPNARKNPWHGQPNDYLKLVREITEPESLPNNPNL